MKATPTLRAVDPSLETPPKALPSAGVHLMNVTPTMAQMWIDAGDRNRPVSPEAVRVIAGDIKAGRWRVNGDTIKIATNGKRIDGEHRLLACVMSGIAIKTYVAFGVDLEARKTIDTGRRRSNGDILSMFHNFKSGKRVAALVGMIDAILENGRSQRSVDEIEAIYLNHMAGIDWVVNNFPTKIVGTAPVSGSIALAFPKAPDKVQRFAVSLASGAGLEAGDPAHTLRELVIREGTTLAHGYRVEFAKKTLSAIRAHIRGESLKKLYATEDAVDFFRPAK